MICTFSQANVRDSHVTFTVIRYIIDISKGGEAAKKRKKWGIELGSISIGATRTTKTFPNARASVCFVVTAPDQHPDGFNRMHSLVNRR